MRTTCPILLTGVGIFTPLSGGAESLVSVDARPLEDPLRPLDVSTKLESEYGDEAHATISVFSKVHLKSFCNFGSNVAHFAEAVPTALRRLVGGRREHSAPWSRLQRQQQHLDAVRSRREDRTGLRIRAL